MLSVIPGWGITLRNSLLNIVALKAEQLPVLCNVQQEGIIVMKPLSLHASSAGHHLQNRRILHSKFSADNLPGSME